MRIGYDTLIEHPLRPSSAINYLKSVLEAVSRIGVDDEFFVFVSPANRHHFAKFEKSNVHLVNCFASNENIAFRILAQQIYVPILARRYKLDVLHSLNQIPMLTGAATVVKLCTLHHHVTPGEFKETKVKGSSALAGRARLFYRRLIYDGSVRRATMVIANSDYTKRSIEEFVDVPPEQVRVVYESVDESFGNDIDRVAAKAHIAERFGVERDYVLYVSNLWYYKNPDGAIRGFAAMRAKYGDDVDLVIAGPDDWGRLPELKALAETLGAADRVRFVGRVSRDDLNQLYAAARVIFYPSFAETFGKPVVEAMKAGVPLVTSNITSMPELAGGAALLVDPSDDDAMAEALHRAASDEALRAELSERAEERARMFSWDRVAAETLAVCREAVARRAALQ